MNKIGNATEWGYLKSKENSPNLDKHRTQSPQVFDLGETMNSKLMNQTMNWEKHNFKNDELD